MWGRKCLGSIFILVGIQESTKSYFQNRQEFFLFFFIFPRVQASHGLIYKEHSFKSRATSEWKDENKEKKKENQSLATAWVRISVNFSCSTRCVGWAETDKLLKKVYLCTVSSYIVTHFSHYVCSCMYTWSAFLITKKSWDIRFVAWNIFYRLFRIDLTLYNSNVAHTRKKKKQTNSNRWIFQKLTWNPLQNIYRHDDIEFINIEKRGKRKSQDALL